jgi:hypothetical protein
MGRKAEKQMQVLFYTSQEVARETFASVQRLSKERRLDPQMLLRITYQGLQGMGWGSLGASSAAKSPKRQKRAEKGS